MEKRSVDVVVLSDLHLGTYGSRAKEIVNYLRSISPQMLILNGDIIDIWQFSKHYFPAAHFGVIKEIVNMMSNGTRVIYITGNHDETLRRYSDIDVGNFQLTDKLVIEINNKMTWVFHGDVFDVTMQHSKWLAKMGAVGYDTLILINRFANIISEKVFKKGKLSLSKKIKNSVKSAVKFINNFEQTAADIGISNNYDYVICGHIHQPQKRIVETSAGKVTYLNSGDWVEHLTSLEYYQNEWKIFEYNEKNFPAVSEKDIKASVSVITDHINLYINSLAI